MASQGVLPKLTLEKLSLIWRELHSAEDALERLRQNLRSVELAIKSDLEEARREEGEKVGYNKELFWIRQGRSKWHLTTGRGMGTLCGVTSFTDINAYEKQPRIKKVKRNACKHCLDTKGA